MSDLYSRLKFVLLKLFKSNNKLYKLFIIINIQSDTDQRRKQTTEIFLKLH